MSLEVEARHIEIAGVGSAIPDRVLTNADLERMVETSDEWITERTGIKERRIASEETATSDLAAEAATAALRSAGLAAEEVELLIIATVTPDHLFPSTACIVQEHLGMRRAAAFDLSAGCSGFAYALEIAWKTLAAGGYQNAVVVGADCLSKITDFTDRTTCVLFGDAAGAAVLQPQADGPAAPTGERVAAARGILATYLGADGGGGDKLKLPVGGSRCPATPQALEHRAQYIKMAGGEVFKFAVRIMGEAAEEVIRRAGLPTEEIDLFIPHQANIRIIDAARKRLGLPEDRVFVNVQHYGNTSAASIPVAMDEAYRSGRMRPGDKIVLVGFGAGLTWGAAALEWTLEEDRG